MCFNQGMNVSATQVIELIWEISSGKAAGIDGLSGESLKYANHILSVLLSICFTCMFKHCYLPIGMLDSFFSLLLTDSRSNKYSSKIENTRDIHTTYILLKIKYNNIYCTKKRVHSLKLC